MAEKTGYEGWAIVELMGHRRMAGQVSEAQIAGAPMLRIDVPSSPPATQFYSAAALQRDDPDEDGDAILEAEEETP